MSSITQRPSLAQAPQAMQPLIFCPLRDTISYSTPFFSKTFPISSSAICVLPLARGLPFIISTFIALFLSLSSAGHVSVLRRTSLAAVFMLQIYFIIFPPLMIL